jgi:hypothetical protein
MGLRSVPDDREARSLAKRIVGVPAGTAAPRDLNGDGSTLTAERGSKGRFRGLFQSAFGSLNARPVPHSVSTAMGGLHRFVRLQLWRLAAGIAVLFVLASVLGAHAALIALEWTPMGLCVVVVAVEAHRAVVRLQRRRD